MLRRLVDRFMDVFEALATGFAVGERLSEGERLQALGMGLALAAPLIFRRRFYSLAGAAGMAVLAYVFWEQLHAREPVLEELDAPPTPADASVN
jgi:hypothetical protein